MNKFYRRWLFIRCFHPADLHWNLTSINSHTHFAAYPKIYKQGVRKNLAQKSEKLPRDYKKQGKAISNSVVRIISAHMVQHPTASRQILHTLAAPISSIRQQLFNKCKKRCKNNKNKVPMKRRRKIYRYINWLLQIRSHLCERTMLAIYSAAHTRIYLLCSKLWRYAYSSMHI